MAGADRERIVVRIGNSKFVLTGAGKATVANAVTIP